MKRAIAINDYTSQSPEQLSFHRGDRFYLLVDTGISEKWYFVTTNISTTSESGFVPRDHVSIQNDETPVVDENSSNSTSYRKNSTSSHLSSPRPPRLSRHSIHQCLTQSQKKFPNVVATVVLNCPATKEWELPVETGDVIRIVEDRGDHILALASSEKSGTSSSSRILGIVPLTAVRFWNTTDGTPILKLNNSQSGVGAPPLVVGGDGKYDEPSYVRVIGYKRNRQSSIDYKISVTTLGNHSYIVRRTYSDFVTLHANMIGSVANFADSKTLPVLPPSLSPEEERETAQRRGKALDLYIATIMALPMTSNRKSFIRKFLGFDDLRRRPSTSTSLENTADVPMRPRQRETVDGVEVEEKDQRISVDSAYRSRKSSTASNNAESIPHFKEPPPVPERWSEENSETSDGSPTRKLSAYTDRFSVNMSALIDSYSYS